MSKYTERARQRQEEEKQAVRELARRKEEAKVQSSRQLRIAEALEHEFSFAREDRHARAWGVAAMHFELKGPIVVRSEFQPSAFYDDDDLILVNLGGLELGLPIAEADGVAFAILKALYDEDWARLLMALCRRCPLDYGDNDKANLTKVAQALWKAAYTYKEQWPDLVKGYDDAIWGVAPPKGVKAQYPEGSGALGTDDVL